MKIAITGATGFIGQYVVDAAVNAGHSVRALARKEISDWATNEKIEVFKCDLTDAASLKGALDGCEALIHLAAVMNGPNSYHDSINATKHVIDIVSSSAVKRVVHLSSISLLDYTQKKSLAVIDEFCGANTNDKMLGDYARMKRDQESLFQHWNRPGDTDLVILRPGLVYDEHNLSNAHEGFKFLAAKHKGQVPVVHAKSVAQACILSAESHSVNNETIQLTNDNLPSQSEYCAALKSKGQASGKITLPWPLFNLATWCLRFPLGLINKAPDGVRLNSVHARQKPLSFSNEKAKQLLQWHPMKGLET